MESLMMRGGAWTKKPPASVYEDSGMDLPMLVFELDRRLAEAASRFGVGGAGNEFKEWFGRAKQFVTAFLFSGGEIVSGGESLLSMHIVADEPMMMGLVNSMPESTACVFAVMLSDPAELAGLCAAERASELRALLSGELMVAGAGAKALKRANDLLQMVQMRFEENAVEDLGVLIAMDMRTELARNSPGTVENPTLNMGSEIFLPNAEFERMAKRAMEQRRVDRILHKKLMPQVKAALGHEKKIMTRMPH